MNQDPGIDKNKFTGHYLLLLLCFCAISFYTEVAAAGDLPSEPAALEQVVATAPADANTPATPAHKPALTAGGKTSTGSQVANLIGGLALILVLIYGLSWFVKRFSQGGFMQNSSIKMLASLPLGTRERLMLVEVGGKQILLGVTAAQINSLYVFDQPAVQASDKTPAALSASSDFSQKLMALLQQKDNGKINPSANNNTQ